MNRSILAGAAIAALACGTAAQAQSAVLYGLIDASGSHVRPLGGDSRWQLDNGNLTRSYLGFRGSDDLGGGLRAVYKLESYLRVDTGSAGRSDGDAFFAREASVGLSGAFGTTVLGRNPSPLWLSTINFNPFGESIGFSPSVRQYFGGTVLGDTRWNNSISYNNNASDAPLRVNVAANANETNPASSRGGHNLGGSISYITGPFAATLAGEVVRNSGQAVPLGFESQNIIQAGATYDFSFVRVYGQIGRVRTGAALDSRTTLYQLGAAVPFGHNLILLGYGHSYTKTMLSGVTNRQGSIAYDYFLSKNTDIYVAALYEKQSFVSSGSSIATGLRLRF
ncbi:MAG: porin [Caldimonas sp.]